MTKTVEKLRAEYLSRTGWFDSSWYLLRCPAAGESAMEPLYHYVAYGAAAGIGPNAWLDGLQLQDGSGVASPSGACDADTLLRLEMGLLEACGLFNAAYYLENNADIVRKGLDPLLHFCRSGWRELRKPHPEFDVWWYWSNYLDPRRETINPLVHYALIGQSAGYRGFPRRYEPVEPHELTDHPVRRICLFAGFDADGVVDEYVIALVRELSRFSDVYYFGDCTMSERELGKLQPYTMGRWAYRHGNYDFGSWAQLAAKYVGWDRIEGYDELLLVNDSGYLLGDLAPVFDDMGARKCDWWGLQASKGMHATRHAPSNQFERPIPMAEVVRDHLEGFRQNYVYDFLVGSYFLAFRQPVLRDPGFRYRLSLAFPEPSKKRLVRKREIALTQYLLDRQFTFATFIDEVYALPPVYTDCYLEVIANGLPFLKRLLLVTNHYNIPGLASWKERLLALVPDAPVEMIERNLTRVADHDKLQRSFAIEWAAGGEPLVPELMDRKQFRRADASVLKYDAWWAFAVDPVSGTLGGNERAVFECVRNDPSIKKIVLTRWRNLALPGENVVVVPLLSAEGQHHLLRAGQIFVSNALRQSLVFPVSESRRNIFDLGAGRGPEHFDWLGEPAALPQWDTVRQDLQALPEDMKREVQQLDMLLGGRRLILLAPAFFCAVDNIERMFPESSVADLLTWLRRHDTCLAIRGLEGADTSALSRYFRSPELLELSERAFPNLEVVYRRTAVVVTDSADCIAGLASSGCGVFGFFPSCEPVQSRVVESVKTGVAPSVRLHKDFPSLCRALKEYLEASAESDRCAGSLVPVCSDRSLAPSAAAVVGHVRALYANKPAPGSSSS